jgi:hypothetical protein
MTGRTRGTRDNSTNHTSHFVHTRRIPKVTVYSIFGLYFVKAALVGAYQSTAQVPRNILVFLFAEFDKHFVFKTVFEKRVVKFFYKLCNTSGTFTQSRISAYQSTARLLRNILIFLFAKFGKKFAFKTVFKRGRAEFGW